MLKKVWVGMLLIFMINLPGLASGQDVPSGKWWYNQNVVKNLNLTQKEIRQLDQLYVDSHRKLIKLKNSVEREQFELDTLLGKKTVDDAKVRKQFKRLESARTDLANERLGFVMRVREIIGAERFQQLKTSYKKWR
ncbi:MAG: periplasmic heavy metal sensor [Deltaproteobacteria bacterium]|jgi:Spy/CpxP family protein refolding chaperone|nr:periplasmic heavy metal sensor [Deltaproteobacteria bacterium]